jgi:hypothetical protein
VRALEGDIVNAREALDAARKLRGQWMMRVASYQASIFDVIRAAQEPYAEALYKMRIDRVLSFDPMVKRKRKVLLQTLIDQTYQGPKELKTSQLTIGWLLTLNTSSDARMRRFVELYLTLGNATDPPTPRFPWTY